MTNRSTKELINQSKGEINPKSLTKTGGILSASLYDKPLIEYLKPAEKPQFMLKNSSKGIEVYNKKREKEYDHKQKLDGKSFLLITDLRIIYVVGSKSGDELMEWSFDEISSVKAFKKNYSILFSTKNDKFYRFSSSSKDLNRAASYISKYISGGDGFKININRWGYDSNKNSDMNLTNASKFIKFGESMIEGKTGYKFQIYYDEIVGVFEREYIYSSEDILLSSILKSVKKNGNISVYRMKGIEFVTESDTHLLVNNCDKDVTEYPEFPQKILDTIQQKVENIVDNNLPYEFLLVEPFDRSSGELKVEGWTDGSSEIDADVVASSQSRGGSRGIELGPFTRSKTSSKSSIEGDISGEITDNTYTADIRCFKLYEEHLIIDSEMNLDLHYSDIDEIYKQRKGVIIEVGSTAFRIDNVSVPNQIDEAVAFIKKQIDTFAEEETAPDEERSVDSAHKLRQLKELHEDGILTDEEFQSKKEELLNDF